MQAVSDTMRSHILFINEVVTFQPFTGSHKRTGFEQARDPSVGPTSFPDISPVYTASVRGAVETTVMGASVRGWTPGPRTEPRRTVVSSEDYDSGAWPGTPAATAAAAGPAKPSRTSGGGGGLIPQPASKRVILAPFRDDVVRFGRMSQDFLTLHQISLRNPNLPPLRLYCERHG